MLLDLRDVAIPGSWFEVERLRAQVALLSAKYEVASSQLGDQESLAKVWKSLVESFVVVIRQIWRPDLNLDAGEWAPSPRAGDVEKKCAICFHCRVSVYQPQVPLVALWFPVSLTCRDNYRCPSTRHDKEGDEPASCGGETPPCRFVIKAWEHAAIEVAREKVKKQRVLNDVLMTSDSGHVCIAACCHSKQHSQ